MSSAKQETRIPELAAAGKDGVCGGQGKEVITDGSQRERKSRIALSRRQVKPFGTRVLTRSVPSLASSRITGVLREWLRAVDALTRPI